MYSPHQHAFNVLPIAADHCYYYHHPMDKKYTWCIVRINKPAQRKRPLIDFWIKEELIGDRRAAIKRSKSNVIKSNNILKRLQRRHFWKMERSERKLMRQDRINKKQERYEFQVSRGKRPASPEKCRLWNCTRKRRQRYNNNSIYGIRRSQSRMSILSDMSVRSRTPIGFSSD